ncbi:MAG: diguanylate cyclase [Gemmatimonadales bacterium]
MFPALAGLLLQLHVVEPRNSTADLGRWLFHAGDDAHWAQPDADDHDWTPTTVPDAWALPPANGNRGYAWYRLHLTITGSPSEPLGLWFTSVSTAYTVFVDGRPLGGSGGFPPVYRARSVIPLVVALPVASQSPGVHVIAVRVYSAESIGGITGSVTVGPVQQLERAAFRPDLLLASTAVLLVGIGLMQLFFWVRRPHAREHAAIFMTCICAGLFFVWWMPSVRVAIEPVTFWFRLYLASAAAAAAAYCYAFRRIFELDRSDQFVRAFAFAFMLQVPVFLAVPSWTALRVLASYVLNPTLLVVSAITLVLVILRFRLGDRHARILLWGTVLLSAALVHDIVQAWGALALRPAFPWMTLAGTVVFSASLAMTTGEKFLESETAALFDRLTGLYRREVVMDALAREIRRAARVHQPLSLIMFDVDRFKLVNDTLGHQAGDKVLAEIGRRMVDAGRAVDWLGRYGGEEFVGVLAGTDRSGGVLAAERIRNAVAALPIATGRTSRTVTLSAGVAAYDGGEEWPTTEQLVGAADAALYRAKNSGRNCVVS